MIKRRLIILLLGIIISSCGSQEEKIEEKGVPVKVYKVKPESISQYIKLTGSVTATEDAIIYSKISEKLDRILVKPGDNVSSGQVIAVQYNAMLQQSVKLAEASVRTAESNLKLTSQEYERINRLYLQKAISTQQFEQITTGKETAEAVLEQAKLQLDQAREQYANSFIKAPFAGIVAGIYFERDQMVPAGQPVAQVISKGGIKAKLKVSSKDVSMIKLNQKVKVTFPSIPGNEYWGTVTKINQALDPFSRLLEIEVKITNPDRQIKSGIFGEFLIDIMSKNNVYVIPESSILQRTEITSDKETGMQSAVKKYFVFVVNEGKAKMKEIKTGITSSGRVEITEGLKLSDNVVIVGQNVVREDQKVKIVD